MKDECREGSEAGRSTSPISNPEHRLDTVCTRRFVLKFLGLFEGELVLFGVPLALLGRFFRLLVALLRVLPPAAAARLLAFSALFGVFFYGFRDAIPNLAVFLLPC